MVAAQLADHQAGIKRIRSVILRAMLMLFNSLEFLFVFLPATLLLFYGSARLLPARVVRRAILVVLSLLFYGFWRPIYLPLLGASILGNFCFFKLSRRYPQHRTLIIGIGVACNLLLLAWFKYADFFIGTLNLLPGSDFAALHIVLPLAISFYTFTQIAFLCDAARRTDFDYSLLDYAFFATYFPHLIAGPVIHHEELLTQIDNVDRPGAMAHNLRYGIALLVLGLVKKVLIADNLATIATPIFAAADAGELVSTAKAWQGALAYTFQLYFDFSGYCDMAIGLSWMFGIKLPINFSAPYRATNIADFWRRWHITLSDFLRDYLYVPLGGSRQGRARRYVNLLATMVLGGLWHGAGWNFVMWGALHGSYLAVHHGVSDLAPSLAQRLRRLRLLNWALTFVAVVLAWVFFRATSWGGATSMLQAMLWPDLLPAGTAAEWLWIGAAGILAVAGCSALQIANGVEIALARRPEHLPPLPAWGRAPALVLTNPVVAALLFLACLWQTITAGAGEFLYFNF